MKTTQTILLVTALCGCHDGSSADNGAHVSAIASAGAGLAWESLGPTIVGNPAAVATGARVDVFGVGTDGAVYHRWWDGSVWQPVSGWESLGNNGSAVAWPAAGAIGNTVSVFVRETSSGHLLRREFDGSNWGAWEDHGGTLAPEAMSVAVQHSVQLFGGPYDSYYVFVRNSGDNSLGLLSGATKGGWYPWTNLGGALQNAPSAVSWGTNRMDVFVRGTDNHLYHMWQDVGHLGGNFKPNSYEQLNTGSLLLGSAPSVASWGANRLDIFFSASDGSINHIDWNGSAWMGPHNVANGGAWRDGTHGISAPTAISGEGWGRAFAVVQGGDRALYYTNMADDGVPPSPRFAPWVRLDDCFRSGSSAALTSNLSSFNIFINGWDSAVYHTAILGKDQFKLLGSATPPACPSGGTGEPCGYNDACNAQLACANGVCSCGSRGLPCCGGSSCDAKSLCNSGQCTECGANGEYPCKSGCNPGLDVANRICQQCGKQGLIACDGWGCLYPMKTVYGRCAYCGGDGKPPCDSGGCEAGLILNGGLCRNPDPTGPTCAGPNETCVEDSQPGMHCCQDTNAPTLCVYGQCRSCVQHGKECQIGGSQLCCSWQETCALGNPHDINDVAVCK